MISYDVTLFTKPEFVINEMTLVHFLLLAEQQTKHDLYWNKLTPYLQTCMNMVPKSNIIGIDTSAQPIPWTQSGKV
jgi:hypothetical protein